MRIARIFNTYGPRMCLDDGRVVSNFVSQVCLENHCSGWGDFGKSIKLKIVCLEIFSLDIMH